MLKGKIAIITGASQGIGRAVAEKFAAHGASVIMADIKPPASMPANARYIECDVGDKQAIDRLVNSLETIDILVNNAGIIHAADFLELSEEAFDRVLRVNLKGSFLMGQAVAKHMVVHKIRGTIINMSSVNAVLAIPNQTAYNVSKGGLKQLTNNMALSLAPFNIRVNAIGPGSINTEMMATILIDDAARHKILSRTPLGRLGEPDEVADTALFLASDQSSYITGQTIYIDGGRMGLNYTVPVN
jgi:NAD(P)-dependent dehydrogenase (short-subunit alcohol dehydrogenase family)